MTETPLKNNKANRRGVARLFAVQALYQLEQGQDALEAILGYFQNRQAQNATLADIAAITQNELKYLPADNHFMRFIVSHYHSHSEMIDAQLDQVLPVDWRLNRLDATLRAILRSGAVELLERRDIPAKVIINEYLDVAHAFFDQTEKGMINNVLDKLAHKTRDEELGVQDPPNLESDNEDNMACNGKDKHSKPVNQG